MGWGWGRGLGGEKDAKRVKARKEKRGGEDKEESRRTGEYRTGGEGGKKGRK